MIFIVTGRNESMANAFNLYSSNYSCYINVTDSIKTALSTLVPAKQSPNSLFKNLVEVFYFFKSSLTSL
jgi:hypothetical protein